MSTADPDQFRGLSRSSMLERVHWGRACADVLREEIELAGSRRVFVFSNRSFAATASFERLLRALSPHVVGVYSGITAHAPRSCALEGAIAARNVDADLLLAVGGGSVIDAAKAAALCLRHGYASGAELEPHANVRTLDSGQRPADAERWVRIIAVPTTLSGAEFAASAGLTDPERGLKHSFSHPMQMPKAVILDPAMTLDTPLALLRATAMKAIDHAAERMTSITANPYSDVVSELALTTLRQALDELGTSDTLGVRTRLQYGMFMSLRGSGDGVAVNVSHALGHVLGAHAGVPHGQTTGILLPAVLQWNREETAAAQARIARALGASDGDAASAVRSLAQRLQQPTRLRDVGVPEVDLPSLAHKATFESLLRNSAKPVRGSADLEEILRLAW